MGWSRRWSFSFDSQSSCCFSSILLLELYKVQVRINVRFGFVIDSTET